MKVALCIPVHSSPAKEFMGCVVEMVIRTMKERPDVELKPVISSSSAITVARHSAVKHALKWGADWLLFLDADHMFPSNALLRLLAKDLDVVGCNYRRRTSPYSFTAIAAGEVVPTTADSPEIEEVEHMGLGFTLIRAEVIRTLDPPFPLFAFQEKGDGYAVGEDFFFYRRLRKAGVQIYVDHRLSMEVGHITQGIVYPGSNVPDNAA